MPKARTKTRNKDNYIREFDHLKEFLESQDESHLWWKENWNIFIQSDGICFYRLSRNEQFDDVNISFKIIVNKNMQVSLRNEKGVSEDIELEWILKRSKLEMWSQLNEILDFYQSEPVIQLKTNQHCFRQSFVALDKIASSHEYAELINPARLKVSDLKQEDLPIDVVIKQESDQPTKADEDMFDDGDDLDDLSYTEEHLQNDTDTEFEDKLIPEARSEDKTNPKKRKKATKAIKPKTPREELMSSTNGIHKCLQCEKVFSSRKSLRSHLYCHVSSLNVTVNLMMMFFPIRPIQCIAINVESS